MKFIDFYELVAKVIEYEEFTHGRKLMEKDLHGNLLPRGEL